MLGINTAFPVSKGLFYGSVEGAYTDPYLYLRDNGSYEQNKGEYGINWVVAVRNFCNDAAGGNFYDESFLGYKYGGDAIVANLNAGYSSLDRWHVEGNLFYMAHGTFDKWTCWKTLSPGENYTTPTTSHPMENNKDPNASSLRNAVSHTVVAGVNAGYEILTGFDVYAQADFITIWNPGNIRADKPITDFQLTVGLGYSF
ncbi:MAG: hypothetical protein SPJ34_04930, partial [Candidatus Ornithospirochaeta sp.]|nr:hypothetical protein [Candidatus Ornithospirochaeta sp.]